MAIIIVMIIGYGLSEDEEVIIEDEVITETRLFYHQFNNVGGLFIANESIYNGSCNILIDITLDFDTELGNFSLLVDGEEIIHTINSTTLEVQGNNLSIIILASGGDAHPDNPLADYYIVKMISNCLKTS